MINELKNSDFSKFLLNSCQSLVLWSGINASYFNAPNEASTANVECYFKNVKQQLATTIPCRVDEFVCAHIQMMEGINREVSRNFIDFVDASGGIKCVLENQYQSDDCESEFLDQWKNVSAVEFQLADENENNTTTNATQATEPSIACIACQKGDAPTGAHKCIKCSKFVHILPGCSQSCGDNEGYGETRICTNCATVSETRSKNTQPTITQLNATEKWSNRKKSNFTFVKC